MCGCAGDHVLGVASFDLAFVVFSRGTLLLVLLQDFVAVLIVAPSTELLLTLPTPTYKARFPSAEDSLPIHHKRSIEDVLKDDAVLEDTSTTSESDDKQSVDMEAGLCLL